MKSTLKNGSITSLLLLLDQEGVDSSQKEEACNMIAAEVEKIITETSQAKTLFQSEKRIIGSRGNDMESYLVREDVSTREVLETYYKGVTDRNNFRRLSNDYTISEMMLMLGTFMHMMEVRVDALEYSKRSARRLKGIHLIRRFTAPQAVDDMNLLETLISTTETSNRKMLSYMNGQVDVVMRAILEEMGSNFGFASKKQLEGICQASYELVLSNPVMASYFRERNEKRPVVQADVLVLESCGEHSPQLQETIQFENAQSKKYQKGTK